MPSEKELLERIRQLELQNSALQDKLDMVWSILASDYVDAEDEQAGEEDDEDESGLIQIDQVPKGKKPQ